MKIKKIQKIIKGITDSDIFRQALTHTSYCHENNLSTDKSYETLEFLGDSILNFQVSRYIYDNFCEFNEGKMSKLKQLMVQESTLAHLSKEIGLINYIKLGSGEIKNKGAEKNSILADIFESFIAALYLTRGNRQVVEFLKETLFPWISGQETRVWDYKSQLQEFCQTHKNSVTYKIQSSVRNSNEWTFIIKVEDKLQTFQSLGMGKNRKAAEQDAAAKILKLKGLIN